MARRRLLGRRGGDGPGCMARWRLLGRRGGDGQGWRGGGCSVGGAETGRDDGDVEAAR